MEAVLGCGVNKNIDFINKNYRDHYNQNKIAKKKIWHIIYSNQFS